MKIIEMLRKLFSKSKKIENLDHLDKSTEFIIALAKTLIEEIQATYPVWQKAYLRLEATDNSIECRASCELPGQVDLLDAFKHKHFSRRVMDIGGQLRNQVPNNGKKFCVLLIVVDSKFDYEVQYEYENSNRWNITKLDGNSGIPFGYTAA